MVLQIVPLSSKPDIVEFLEKDRALVFLYGPTCGPCNRLKPKLYEDLATISNHITLGTINAQAYPELRTCYAQGAKIPFLIVFEKSDPVHTLQSSDIHVVRAFLNRHLDLEIVEPFDVNVEF